MNAPESSEPDGNPDDRQSSGPEPPWPPAGTGRWMLATLIVGLAILAVELWPFMFDTARGRLLALHYSSALLVLGQVALFVPFGFVETQLARRLFSRATGLLVLMVMIDGLLLSLVGETAQYWLPARNSSIVDLAANTLGTVVGYKLAALLMRA